MRPAHVICTHTQLFGIRLYLLSLTGADACHRMMRRCGMHPMSNVGPCGVSMHTSCGVCGACTHVYTYGAAAADGDGPAVLAVRTELIADATDVSRDAPRYAAALHRSTDVTAEMHRDTPRLSTDVSRDAPRGSPHTVTGGSCGAHPVWMCRPGSPTVARARARAVRERRNVRGLTRFKS